MTLGDYERRLEDDKVMVGYADAAAKAIAGIATGIGGLGIGGGLLLGALLFRDDIKDLLNDWLPNSDYEPFSPEWVASIGDDPEGKAAELATKPDNHEVDTLVNDEGETLTGQSVYEAYQNGASGRQAEYDYRVGVAATNYTEAQMANWLNYPTNRPPPERLSLDGFENQIRIRVTCARRRLFKFTAIGIFFRNTDPEKESGYHFDPMLDWAAGATYNSIVGWDTGSGIWSTTDRRRQEQGKRQIELFMNWTAPTQAP